ncbi:MAG TPA: protein-glutamate O-methyltransferase CheR [Clostridia bacterium]|nr:protein-glutamate O-methyltransferase CheR [Clostridia bacterium]
MLVLKDDEFMQLAQFMKSNYGINLFRKKTLIEGRLSNLVIEKGFSSFGEYIAYAMGDKTGKEVSNLINKLTTNHTFFMREKQHFDYMKEVVLPYLSKNIRDHDMRIWSAGCSSGEEPYTLEMILHDYFGDEKHLWDTEILATDISSRALEKAKTGIYPAEAVNDIPPFWKLNYFQKQNDGNVAVSEKIKKEIVFRVFNLMQNEFPFRKKFHVIFCRNVMIYFDQKTKNELVQKFYDHTEPGGYLFIGHSESIDRELTKYQYIMPAVYRKVI